MKDKNDALLMTYSFFFFFFELEVHIMLGTLDFLSHMPRERPVASLDITYILTFI